MTLESRFNKWQWALAIGHYVAAIIVLHATDGGIGWEVPVVVRYNIWSSSDGRCSGDTGCTINEFERVLDDPLKTGLLVSSFSFISGSHHAIVAGLGERYIDHVVQDNGVAVLRWVDYAFSASLMLMMDSALWLSPPTVQMLIVMFCVMFLVIVSGYGSEVAWAYGQSGHALLIYLAALAPFVCVWASTWAVFAEGANPKAGGYAIRVQGPDAPELRSSDPPDFVIVILVWLFLTYCSFPAVHCWRIVSKEPAKTNEDVIVAESAYSFLSWFAKIPLLAVYGTAVAARSNRITVGKPPPEDVGSINDGTFDALGTAVGLSLLLGGVMWYDIRRQMKK